MKRQKKLLAFLLCAFMLLSLCACAGDTQGGSTPSTGGSPASSGAPDSTPESGGTDTGGSEQEPYTVKILMCGDANTADCEAVAAAASEITLEKWNTTIELVRYGYSAYADQQNLMLASGEKLDLMASMSLTTPNGANNGQILPLDDLLKSDGQDLLAAISDVDWGCTSVNGQIYGVRNNKELATGYGYAMLTAVLDELGVDPETIKTEADFDALLRQVKEAYPDMYPLVSDRGTMGWYIAYFDELGGDYGVLENCTTDDTTVVNLFETDTYKNAVTARYNWQQEGLMLPDGASSSEGANDLMAAGKAFARITNVKPGIAGELERGSIGQPVTVIEMTDPFSCTSHLSNQWYIAHNSEQPARAMQILNEMYVSEDLCNLFINGVEGQHYILKDESSGIIGYPDGVDATNTGYSTAAWAWPNELISYVWEMDSPTLWTDTTAFNEEAAPSPAKGFTWNNESVLSEIAACNNALAKYRNALDCGDLNPEEALPKLNAELEAAGLKDIIREKQAQLDAWLAAK